jgi:glycine cleavage system H protein
MSETRYLKSHEYIRIDGETGTVGITDYAQSALGDVVYVELPAVGATLKAGAEAAVVESVKAASEVYTPVSGTVIEVNSALESNSGLINEDPEGAAWFFKIKLTNPSETSDLMTADTYKDFLSTIG